MQVDSVQQRTRETRSITVNVRLGTNARASRDAVVATRAGIHRRDEREARRIRHDR